MSPNQGYSPTYLFLVRLWVEPLADDQSEVRMQVKHILSGETRYFRLWSDVEEFLLAKVQELEVVGREPKDGPS